MPPYLLSPVRWLPAVVLSLLVASAALSDDFPEPVNTEKSPDQPMPADQVVATATLPEGFQMTVFAAEPDVQNPIAIATDHRDRLWVLENYSWAGAGEGHFRTDFRDRILVFEDTDGDGVHDRRAVFYDRLTKATSVEIGFGGVWVIALPQLLFIPDRDDDGVPDGPPEVILDGLDDNAISHNAANGLRWGPDGWLYARHGILATSFIGRPGASDSQRTAINTGLWRYHPTSHTVQAVMHGMTNSWGMDYNATGDIFCINTVIGHLWHAIPGARTQRMFGADLNPRAYQLLPQVADHYHWDTGQAWHEARDKISDTTLAAGGGHAHIGLLIYQGDNWPAEYRDHVYTMNMHGRRINRDRLERQGTGFVAKHTADPFLLDDPFYRGIDLLTGADGGVYLADWSDTGECHDHDGVHRTSGRIYKLTYGTPEPTGPLDVSRWSNRQLLEAQLHPNAWYGRQARRVLQERRAAAPQFTLAADDLPATDDPIARLHLAWARKLAGEQVIAEMAQDADIHQRAWAIRYAADDLAQGAAVSDDLIAAWSAAIADDPDGYISLHVASAVQSLPVAERLQLATALLQQASYADDRFYPIMAWLAIEAGVTADPDAAADLVTQSQIPLVTRNLARLAAEEINQHPQTIDRLIQIAGGTPPATAHHGLGRELILGLAEGLAGRLRADPPASWSNDWRTYAAAAADDAADDAAVDAAVGDRSRVADDEPLRLACDQLNVLFGDGQAMGRLMAIAASGQYDLLTRHQAAVTIAAGKVAEFEPILVNMLGDRWMYQAALQGLIHYDSPVVPERALAAMDFYTPEAKADLIRLLVSRPSYAAALLDAVQRGRVPVQQITAFHAQQIDSFGDPQLSEKLRAVWGDVRPSDEAKQQQMEQLRSSLTADRLAAADLSHGRLVFNNSCGNCHILYGQGIHLGPDLTGSNRSQLEYLLENIIDPSAVVPADFRTTVFVLDDGRVLSGVIQSQSEQAIAVRTADALVNLDRESIVQSQATGVSLMPEALLNNLSEAAVVDLFAYLMHRHQVPLPGGDASEGSTDADAAGADSADSGR